MNVQESVEDDYYTLDTAMKVSARTQGDQQRQSWCNLPPEAELLQLLQCPALTLSLCLAAAVEFGPLWWASGAWVI